MINEIASKLLNKKILILGFGKEGQSTYEFIRKNIGSIPLTIKDQNESIKNLEVLKKDKDISIITGDSYLKNLEEYDCIIKSPGISLKDIDISKIKDKLTSQLELFLEVAKDRTIGVTGTKGKSTTASLIYAIIHAQNSNVKLAGNIGTPILSILEECDEKTLFVIEMSSHQLEFIKTSPHIGIILNLFEDHLDHAGNVEHYHECKLQMFQNQRKEDFMIYCSDNDNLNKIMKSRTFLSKPLRINKESINADVYQKEQEIYFGHKVIYNAKEPRKLIGEHNLENIMVALLIGEILGLSNETTKNVIAKFEPLDYRLQKVGRRNDVDFYMDTLATIPEATIESIKSLKKVNTLIFGGMDRGISYEKLIQFLQNSEVENLICMPVTGHTIGKKLNRSNVYFVESLEEAVEIAKKITKKETICLLSPAAPSYDKFKNYQEKGDKFKEYVLK